MDDHSTTGWKTVTIPEGLPKGADIRSPIPAVQGNTWGKHEYRGPKQPPFVRKAHRYRFQVYGLNCILDISSETNKAGLLKAMEGHVLDRCGLTEIYEK